MGAFPSGKQNAKVTNTVGCRASIRANGSCSARGKCITRSANGRLRDGERQKQPILKKRNERLGCGNGIVETCFVIGPRDVEAAIVNMNAEVKHGRWESTTVFTDSSDHIAF